jgi:hypothetical protein
MKGTKLIVSAVILVGFAVASACSSSSGGPAADAGTTPEAGPAEEAGDDAVAVTACNPLLGMLCAAGQTCCSSGLQGTCVDIGSCARPFQVGCIGKASCAATGEQCCGAVSVPPGFDASARFDGSSDFDASGFALTLVCQATCSPSEFLACLTTTDCPSGQVCESTMGSPLPACIPVDAGGADADDGAAPEAGADDAG